MLFTTLYYFLYLKTLTNMATRKELAEKHSFLKETVFQLKVYGLTIQHAIRNRSSGISRFEDTGNLLSYPVVATSKSELWNKDDNAENWIMTAGKIQNLRLAASRINGVEIPAGELFSFWKYIGKPSKKNGYIVGREIREGCIVPSIGGGLCQLSNALYDAAVKAGFQIVERHRHSQVVKGSLAEQDRDATIKWNYLDLRFCSDEAFRIEIEMDAEYLYVRIRSKQKGNPLLNVQYVPEIPPSPLNDCYSCWNTDCYICNTKDKISNTGVTTYILDDRWPEYERYVNENVKDQDYILAPLSDSTLKLLGKESQKWKIAKGRKIYYQKEALKRLYSFHKNKGGNLFSWQLGADEPLVRSIIRKIPVETTHLVVAHNMLPFLYKYFALGGRTYDILMTRSSIRKLQAHLDVAFNRYKDSPTLCDFRAPERIMLLEDKALAGVSKIITAHGKVATEFDGAIKLDWDLQPIQTKTGGKKILFPASLLARKGAYEIRRLAEELNIQFVVHGKAVEYPDFLSCEYTQGDIFDNIGLVVLPAYVENRPQLILKAISLGIPVIITEACGISPQENVIIVPTGDYETLKKRVEEMCHLLDIYN